MDAADTQRRPQTVAASEIKKGDRVTYDRAPWDVKGAMQTSRASIALTLERWDHRDGRETLLEEFIVVKATRRFRRADA